MMKKNKEQAAASAEAFIDAHGGSTVIARVINVSPQCVNNWKDRGISKRGRVKISLFADKIAAIIKAPKDANN